MIHIESVDLSQFNEESTSRIRQAQNELVPIITGLDRRIQFILVAGSVALNKANKNSDTDLYIGIWERDPIKRSGYTPLHDLNKIIMDALESQGYPITRPLDKPRAKDEKKRPGGIETLVGWVDMFHEASFMDMGSMPTEEMCLSAYERGIVLWERRNVLMKMLKRVLAKKQQWPPEELVRDYYPEETKQ